MARQIPNDFNHFTITLDPLERTVRDKLCVNIENWAKFRQTISASASSDSLVSNEILSKEVKSSFVELSKSHYEVVTILGATKMSLNILIFANKKDPLLFKKSFKEFYMHAGSVLDNLARLIYIVNVSDSITKGETKYGRFILKRHDMGYGSLLGIYKNKKSELKGYFNIIKDKQINEIKTVRNNFTHSWSPIIYSGTNLEAYWPNAMRKKEQYYLWPHDKDERKRVNQEYRKKTLIIEMVSSDWNKIEAFQNIVFKKLIFDIKKFEKNHHLKIT